MAGYTKLHSTILDSSVWAESIATRIVWITMLAMADQNGVVQASVGGLARRANVTRVECEEALSVFLGPDPDSRDGTTGERIERVPGGWLVLNHANYRDKQTREQEQTAARVARHRARLASVTGNDVTDGNAPKRRTASASLDSDAAAERESVERGDADGEPKRKKPSVLAEKPEDVGQEVWDSWMVVRKSKNAKVTTVVMAGMKREADRAGWTLEAAIRECAERNWQAFKAAWVSNKEAPFSSRPATGYVSGNSHVQNTPLGSITCQCHECVKYRLKHGIKGIGEV